MRDWLMDGFRYDLWANRRWAPLASGALEEVGWATSSDDLPQEPLPRLSNTLAHIVWAERVWLARLGVDVVSEGEAWLECLHEGWISVLAVRDIDEAIRYQNTKGVSFERPIGEIAWHVVNHGTYHRGQMREIADQAGLDFPETDLSIWQNSRRLNTPCRESA